MDKEIIFFSVSDLKVVTAQHLLKEAGIESFVVNKQDSAFSDVFGEIELHINKKDAEKAKEILVQAEIL